MLVGMRGPSRARSCLAPRVRTPEAWYDEEGSTSQFGGARCVVRSRPFSFQGALALMMSGVFTNVVSWGIPHDL